MFQIVHIESGKAQEIDETISFLSSTVDRVHLIREIPEDVAVPQLENVESAALYLFSTIMEYLAIAITHLKQRLAGQYKIHLFSNNLI